MPNRQLRVGECRISGGMFYVWGSSISDEWNKVLPVPSSCGPDARSPSEQYPPQRIRLAATQGETFYGQNRECVGVSVGNHGLCWCGVDSKEIPSLR